MNPPDNFESKVSSEELQAINESVKEKGTLDREHILRFLQAIPTTDGPHIINEVKKWLIDLHNDPNYARVSFPGDDINAIISDLDSYGHVSSDLLYRFKQEHGKTVPMS